MFYDASFSNGLNNSYTYQPMPALGQNSASAGSLNPLNNSASHSNIDTGNGTDFGLSIGRDPNRTEKTGKTECQTCKERKYQDGSDECNVSFKSASHISPESAPAKVRAHEGEHVANAYKTAALKGGKVLQASVAIHTAVCPECGRTYVSGGTTTTRLLLPNEAASYGKDAKSIPLPLGKGNNIDYKA